MSDKKDKKQYTKQDSAAFKAYQENLAAFPADAANWVDDEFKLEFAEFQNTSTPRNKGKNAKPSIPRDLEGTEALASGYLAATDKEYSDSIVSSTLNLEKLQASYDKDYSVFQEDSTKYEDVKTSLDILQSEWDARESASPTTYESMFNLYPKDSSMGILNTQIGELKGKKKELYNKTFKKHGRISGSQLTVGEPGISYEDRLKMRKSGLNKLAESIKKKEEFYNSLKKIENKKLGY